MLKIEKFTDVCMTQTGGIMHTPVIQTSVNFNLFEFSAAILDRRRVYFKTIIISSAYNNPMTSFK